MSPTIAPNVAGGGARRALRLLAVPALLILALAAACSNGGGGEEIAASPLLDRNESWSYTFDEPGTYQIRCHPHPHMHQTVHVVEPGEDAPGESTTEARMEGREFRPREIRVEVGHTVTWTNRDDTRHDVSIRVPEQDES
ncbi:MAG TPA: hypothetical protein VIO14_13065 [Dehalococcoidia bacterium]